MFQYRVCWQTEDGSWQPDDKVFTEINDAIGLVKDLEGHYRQFPGDKVLQRIEIREVSNWEVLDEY